MEFVKFEGYDFFYSFINFWIMFYIFNLVCIQPMLQAVKLRERRVQKRLDDIETVLEEARATEATYKAQFEKLTEEKASMAEAGEREVNRIRQRIETESTADAKHLVEKAGLEADKARRLALADLQGQLSRAAMVEAESLLTRAFDSQETQANSAENFLAKVGAL